MTRRLTDEELAEFAKMYDGIRKESVVRRVIDEVIERRAADLTPGELADLRDLADKLRCAMFGKSCTDVLCAETQAGVAVLDKLTKGRGG